MAAEYLILVLRFSIVIVLYLFLFQLMLTVWRDLRRASSSETGGQAPSSRLLLLDAGETPFKPGHLFPIAGTATIGRAAHNSIVLSDSFVSSDHALLAFRDGGWWLTDMGSRNGTILNSDSVDGDVRVRPGDVIAIGNIKLKLSR